MYNLLWKFNEHNDTIKFKKEHLSTVGGNRYEYVLFTVNPISDKEAEDILNVLSYSKFNIFKNLNKKNLK